MSASPDHAASDTGLLTSPPVTEPAQEIVNQMADVAAAMFSLLLLQSPGGPAQQVPHTTAEPEDSAAGAHEVPSASGPLPETPVRSVPMPALDPSLDPALDPALDRASSPAAAKAPGSIPMPTSIPMPAPIPMPDLASMPDAVDEPPAAERRGVPDSDVPVVASNAPPTLAMLSEIGFLDD